MNNALFTLFIVSLLAIVVLGGCNRISPDELAKLPLYEQALKQPSRWSDDKERDTLRKPDKVLEFSGIQPGMKVIDLLGGGGFYTELFDYIVGNSGKVYLQNNSLFLRFSTEELEKRLKDNRLKNVVRLDSEFADMKLPAEVDLIFIGLSYHDIYVPREDPVIMTTREEFFPQIMAALKPGGKLLIIDHAARPGSGKADTAKLHRIDEDWAKKDITSAGFEYVGAIDDLRSKNDDYSLDIWKKEVRGKTDRFVHLYQKPE